MLKSQNLALFTAIKTAIKIAIKNHKFFFIFVFFYCVFLVAFSRYAPNLDDLSWFESIIFNEAGFFHYGGGNPSRGRFYPFAFIDLLILMQISKSPYLFFGANALLFALFCTLYLKILNISLGKSALNALITALLALSTAFVIVFFGICYPEKIQVIWIAIFMLCSFFVIQKPTNTNQLFGILSLNIALYYKEPTFIAAFVFGTILLLYARQNSRKDLQKYAIYVVCSSLLYALLYVVLVLSWSVREYYSQNIMTMSDFVECAISDSLIVFCVSGMVLFRVYCVIFKKEQIEPFFDGLLCASFTYFAVFMVLKKSAPYYLLPCFVLGIPSLLYFGRKYFCNIFIKIVLFFGLFGFVTQNLPSGIHKMIDLKAQGVQFHKTLDFVAQYLRKNKGADIYFEGIGKGKRLYGFDAQIYSFYFVRYALSLHKVDADIWILRTNAASYEEDKMYDVQYSEPKIGDLIIVSNKSAFGDSLQVASERGELIFKSGFPSVPQIALMPLVKWLNVKYFKSEFFGKGTNFFATPLETYVFKVK